ncbi:MAG: deoxyribodipyrimidine photolyase-related [Chitinophagaceae bacterium]|nr:MAG: deoxyribodipyrimidine photolyase-related [Chitinophagaceae bacterium]
MSTIGIVFPHQLFEENILLAKCNTIYLVEEWLFFKQYNFTKHKIAFHRASMKFYESQLKLKNINTIYIDAVDELCDIRLLIPHLKSKGVKTIEYIDTTDYWLEKRIHAAAENIAEKKFAKNNTASNSIKENTVTDNPDSNQLKLIKHASPLFLNTSEELATYFSGRKRMFHTDFYKSQRISRNILMEEAKNPVGGKLTFDEENRLKYPKDKKAPAIQFLQLNAFYKEAITYTEKHFANNYGTLTNQFLYPTTFTESKQWLQTFLADRFKEFGAYEDAIVVKEHFLHHSILTPMLNVGLLTPQTVVDAALNYAKQHKTPINSVEGFIRQIIGWREFIRAVYELKGSEERTKNYWKFTRKIPASFWKGNTGIEPIDATIKKILETGYCHHIERLMVLGNFMLLCEFDPDEVYRWFMESFIDAYDWVMVPNVYGMSQFADGGLMATKPYISGSNYLNKMSERMAKYLGWFILALHAHT